jgi:DNA-binding transcriptional MerR regulator
MGRERTPFLETPEVLRLTGLPYSTLDYWVRTGLVTPSVRASSGKRRTRRWSVRDVVCVRAIQELRRAGASVHMLAKARDELQEHWSDSLTGQLLVWDGRDVLMVDAWENVVSLVRHPGQAALQLVALPVAAYAAEVANLAEVARRPDVRRAAG